MRKGKRITYVSCNLERVVDRKNALPGKPSLQGLATDVLHHIEWTPFPRPRVVDMQDVGMLQPRSDL